MIEVRFFPARLTGARFWFVELFDTVKNKHFEVECVRTKDEAVKEAANRKAVVDLYNRASS